MSTPPKGKDLGKTVLMTGELAGAIREDGARRLLDSQNTLQLSPRSTARAVVNDSPLEPPDACPDAQLPDTQPEADTVPETQVPETPEKQPMDSLELQELVMPTHPFLILSSWMVCP